MVQCPSQNVGKTKTLEIIASAMGVPDSYEHPMILSGGDNIQSGTSM